MAVDDKILKMLSIMEDDSATDAEKEAAAGRIQHLATIHAIDLEKLRFQKDNRSTMAEPITRSIVVSPDPLAGAYKNRFWVDLMLEVGRENDLRMTISHDRSRVTCYGYETDIEFVEMLFKSLATQMVMACDAALKRGDHKTIGVHGKTYRPNFYEAFIRRIGSRLAEAKREATAAAKKQDEEIAQRISAVISDRATAPVDSSENAGTELVLATKRERVAEFYDEKTRGKLSRGGYRQQGAGNYVPSAQAHGRDAANSASLGSNTSLPGSRKAIN